MRLHATLLIALLLFGCANPINRRTAQIYYTAGEQALAAGDLALAKRNFQRALVNAQLGHLGPAAEAEVGAKLARVMGNLCEHDAAEQMFLRTIDGYQEARSYKAATARLELAQFSYDVGRYEKATGYFDEAFRVAGDLLEQGDPVGYAEFLRDYADALHQLGRADAAEAARRKAAGLQANTGGSKPVAVKMASEYVRYPKSCK